MIGFGGSKFFIFSMLFDKVLMIFLRYGKFILFACISIFLSSYLYFGMNYGTHLIKIHNLINRPEVVFKYFWSYLKYYYHNRSELPISETAKLIGYIVAPYIFLKLILLISNFSKFWIAMSLKNKYPIISNFLLRRTILSSGMKDKIINVSKKSPTSTTIKNAVSISKPRTIIQSEVKNSHENIEVNERRNLRK